METYKHTKLRCPAQPVYSEVEPFEGWKLTDQKQAVAHVKLSIARLNPLRDGNFHHEYNGDSGVLYVYSEVEPFEGWKLIAIVIGDGELPRSL